MDHSLVPRHIKTETAISDGERIATQRCPPDERSQVIDLCDSSESESQGDTETATASVPKLPHEGKQSTSISRPPSNPEMDAVKASGSSTSRPKRVSQDNFISSLEKQVPSFPMPPLELSSSHGGDTTNATRFDQLKRSRMFVTSLIKGYETRKQELRHGTHENAAEKAKACERMVEKYTRFRDLLTNPTNDAVVHFVCIFEDQVSIINNLHDTIRAQGLKMEEMRADVDAKMVMIERLDAKLRYLDTPSFKSRATELPNEANAIQHRKDSEGEYLSQNKYDRLFAALSARVANLEAMMEGQVRARDAFHNELVKIENKKEHGTPVNREASQQAVDGLTSVSDARLKAGRRK